MDQSKAPHEEYAELLSKVDLLAGLDRITLAKLSAYLEPVSIKAGEFLFQQGDYGDAFYIVSKGSFAAYVHGPDETKNHRIKTLQRGDSTGEVALLTNGKRLLSIQAIDDAEVLRLDRIYFLDLVDKEASVAMAAATATNRKLSRMFQSTWFNRLDDNKIDDEAHDKQLGDSSPLKFTDWFFNKLFYTSLFAVLLMLTTWNLTPPSGLSVSGWHLLITIFAFLPAIALDVLPDGILAFLLISSWVLGDIVPSKIALSGYGTSSFVLVVSIMLAGSGMASSGFLYRLVLWTAEKTGGSYPLSVLGLMFSGLVVGPGLPNATSRMSFIAPLITDLVDALNIKRKSGASVGLSMAAFTSFGQLVGTTLTSSTTALLIYSILPADSKALLNWLSWVQYAAPLNVVIILGLLGTIFYFYRQDPEHLNKKTGKEHLYKLQKAILGKMTSKEWWAVVVGIGLLAGFLLEPFHGISAAWIAVFAAAILATVQLVTSETIKSINWSFILLFGMLNSLSEIFAYTHLDQWLSVIISDFIRSYTSNPTMFLTLFTLICFLVSIVIRWQAAAPFMTLAMAPVAAAMGINPLIIGIIAVIACNIFFQPYQNTMYMALYHGTEGKLFTHKDVRPMAIAYAVFTLLGVLVSIPFWRYFGLIDQS